MPAKAVLAACWPGQTDVSRWLTLETQSIVLGPPEPGSIEFEFEPGMLIADNRVAPGEGAKILLVGQDGQVELISKAPGPVSSAGARGFGLGVLALVAVALPLGIRAYMAHARRCQAA